MNFGARSATNFKNSEMENTKTQCNSMKLLNKLEKIIFNINDEKSRLKSSRNNELIRCSHLIFIQLCYICFSLRFIFSQKNLSEIFLRYIKSIQSKEISIKSNSKIVNVFSNYISELEEQEAYYLLEKLVEQNLINTNIIKNIHSKYFGQYKTDKENKTKYFNDIIEKMFIQNYEELKKNNFALHKQLIKGGVNPNEIVKIIRNDDIEKLQEISSQQNFDSNQKIEPSLYERCSFINKENVTLIDYAAYFAAIKCFKHLLLNGANVRKTGKYAIAGGNQEIIHLCEQNHSTFEDGYEVAIKYHSNEIFKYVYDNKLEKKSNLKLNQLGEICIKNGSYGIFSYLEKEGMKIDNSLINESARNGNIFLIKYFLQNNQMPKDILVFSAESGNIELVKYIFEQKGIDINYNEVSFNDLMVFI